MEFSESLTRLEPQGETKADNAARTSRRRFLQSTAGAMALNLIGLPGASQAVADDREDGRLSDDRRSSGAREWVASWGASAHGLYPTGTAIAQPDLSFAFPDPALGTSDQTFRLIVRPTLWSNRFRLRFSNFLGTQPLTLSDVFLGLQSSDGALVTDTNRRVTFANGTGQVTIPAGGLVYSDPVELGYVRDPEKLLLDGRKLAVSFHVVWTSGPMTWHSKALQTSYVTAPGAGSRSEEESDESFPYSTASWYFLDALDAWRPDDATAVVAFGDSITDGTGSTLNGDDRWPDVLARRLHFAYGNHVSVVNAGVGGNRILTDSPAGGPSAITRLQRDVLSLPGVSAIIWLEGINDLSAGASAEAVIGGIQTLVDLVRKHDPKIKIVQATITSSLGSTNGTPELDARRQAINAFIRGAGIFDAVVDFDAVTVDPNTGELRREFLPNSTTAVIDRLHPNRAGYLAMGQAVDIDMFVPFISARRRWSR
jgi:lysophospholipase L1-like esterase